MQYDKNQNVSLLSAPIPIKSLPGGTKVLHLLIAPGIKEGDCSDSWKFVARHCANGSFHIQDIYFDWSYIPVAHDDSLMINISITAIYRLTDNILDVSNALQNTDDHIHERVCFIPPPCYLDWFENIISMLLSIYIKVHLVFNASTEFR